MKKPHTILAELFCMDSRDVHEMRHHYGHTHKPIYVIGDDYFCVSQSKPIDEYGAGWVKKYEHDGRTIWQSDCA